MEVNPLISVLMVCRNDEAAAQAILGAIGLSVHRLTRLCAGECGDVPEITR